MSGSGATAAASASTRQGHLPAPALIALLRTAAVAGGVLTLIGTALMFAVGHAGTWWSQLYAVFALLSIFFAVFTWPIAPRQPWNAVVWTMAAASFFGGCYIAGIAAGALVVDDPTVVLVGSESVIPAELPSSVAWLLMFSNPAVLLLLFPLLTFGLLLFPDGRLPSPRWRWVAGLAAISIPFTTVVFAWGFRPGNTGPADDSDLLDTGFVVVMVAVVLSLVALVRRFRGSTGSSREQFKWVVWGATIFVPANVVAISLGGTQYENLALAPFAIATALFLTSYGIAVGRYRLFDIDLVINKTVVVGVLAAILTAIYVAVIVGVGSVLGSGDETNFGLQVAATALVAIAFGPVRRRAQQWANRAVYGQRATPYEVLARFSHRAADASDDELLARIPRLIVEGTAAAAATIWVRSTGGFRAAAAFPEPIGGTHVAAEGSFDDPDADYSLPVFHDGELLGGLSLVKTRGEALAPAEERLVESLAAGMGLALRNTELTTRLRRQVAELEASRERILAAADEARRALEHDLDAGPQQQLVALKVMLGPIRKRAAQAGATKTARVLAELEADAGEAIRAVREFSGGVYPALLEAEGLVVAITHQTQKAAVPVSVESRGLHRYTRDTEAAVYFTILEAIQNAAKYANASVVTVDLREEEGGLEFVVTDGGSGFDVGAVTAGSGLANMADRLDAVGGVLSLESVPGSGTTIRGAVPIGDRVRI